PMGDQDRRVARCCPCWRGARPRCSSRSNHTLRPKKQAKFPKRTDAVFSLHYLPGNMPRTPLSRFAETETGLFCVRRLQISTAGVRLGRLQVRALGSHEEGALNEA